MLTLLQILGLSFLIAGPIVIAGFIINYGIRHPKSGLGKWVYKWWPFEVPKAVKARMTEDDLQGRDELREATTIKSKEDQLLEAKVNAVLTILSQQISVRGRNQLLQLSFFDGNPDHKVHIDPSSNQPLAEYPWLTLDNGDVITQLPDKEAGELRWFYATNVIEQAEVPPTEFLKEYGIRFAKSLQKAKVVFEYPGFGECRWRCTDIVWADCKTQGKNRFGSAQGPMTRVSMLLSKDDRSGEFLLFAMIRGGPGNHGLYRLRQFNPEVEIEEIL